MQTFDIVMTVVLGGSVLIGAWKGMVWQISMVGSILGSFYVARTMHQNLAEAIGDLGSPWSTYLAMGALYILTSMLIWFLHGIVQKKLEKHDMKTFDHQTGGLMGIVNGALLCSVLTVTMVAFTGEETHGNIAESKSGVYINKMVKAVRDILPADVAEPINKHFDTLNTLIEQGSPGSAEPEEEPQVGEVDN